MLGAHFVESDGKKGVRFAVWAPHAKSISVVGDFNEWDTRINPMTRGRDGEIWEVFVPGIEEGAIYKYAIEPQWGGPRIMKADPYGFYAEKKPNTASSTTSRSTSGRMATGSSRRRRNHPMSARC